MSVIFIPKLKKDFTIANNWWLLNPIPPVGKIGEKVEVEQMHDVDGRCFTTCSMVRLGNAHRWMSSISQYERCVSVSTVVDV